LQPQQRRQRILDGGVTVANINATKELLEAVAKVLLFCSVFGFLLVLIWFAFYMIAPGMIYSQAKWFNLTAHEVDLIHYCGIAFVKSCVILFFLFPYVSIRLTLRNNAS
jgi:hypothetical protein